MNIYRRAKQFAVDHEDSIVFVTAATVTVAAFAGLLFVAAKEKEEQDRLEAWTKEQNFEGKTVLQLADGSHIAVAKEQVS